MPLPTGLFASRRQWLAAGAGLGLGGGLGQAVALAAPAEAKPRTLKFPRDAGAHLDFQTEWWYLTGWASAAGSGSAQSAAATAPDAAYGFQITFFRSRVDTTQGLQSRLAARHLLFAHAAITDVRATHLWHDQRIARWSGEAPGDNPADTASASALNTGVVLNDWSLLRDGADLRAQLRTQDFAMDLRFAATQPLLLQGQQGLSRKGPEPRQTSYYYSLPQLQVSGSLSLQGKALAVGAGSTAWLDHEWSDEMLPTGAVGWDWLGINLFDGSALTAFQLRDKNGAALWDGGSFRAGTSLYTFSRGEVTFKPQRLWRSPSSRASYPVEWLVRTPADFYMVRALVDNQELDSRNSTGAIYWEGLCEVWDSNGHKVGRGYLEMTGYAAPLKM
ncbi:carotenoid 1,2-hydratase [Rhodoferax lacus]|uniref:lipocalin-like domain-containing protein n=1 Tax=Rhodoferax lacus TaxID=2184758 RepID=UPI001F1D583F|nr:carotenoid 1,2-hydratase [Rhodoferax lacus]